MKKMENTELSHLLYNEGQERVGFKVHETVALLREASKDAREVVHRLHDHRRVGVEETQTHPP